ncbi:MAG: GntR family transcriptional regulator [Candidatus Puniceispirillales bacterium]
MEILPSDTIFKFCYFLIMDFEYKNYERQPRYQQIFDELKALISANRSLDGVVVSVNMLASIFQTSRTPVHQAMQMLEKSNLAIRINKKAEFVLNHAKDSNRKIPEILKRFSQNDLKTFFHNTIDIEKQRTDHLHLDMEQHISNILPFGAFWINEQKAADTYNVSRTIIRQSLSKFAERGLIGKDYRAHWTVGPLTSKMLNDLFSIRSKLEPLALIDAAQRLDNQHVNIWLERCYLAKENVHSLDQEMIKLIENDLHVDLLNHSQNTALKRLIDQTQLALVVNDIFAKPMNGRPFIAALSEHIIIYEYLIRDAVDAAAMALENHIKLSAKRTNLRLKALSIFPTPPIPSWLTRRSP